MKIKEKKIAFPNDIKSLMQGSEDNPIAIPAIGKFMFFDRASNA